MAKSKAPIVLTDERKWPGWCGGLSGCLRSSKEVVLPSKAKHKHPIETSSEEDEEEEHEVLNRLTEQIDKFLNLARSQDDEWSDKLASFASTMFTSSSEWLNSMSHNSRMAYEKLTSNKYGHIIKSTEEIFTAMSKAHWAAAGLLVVAVVINSIQKVKHVDKECLKLLRSMHTMGVSLNRLSRLPHRPPEMESNLQEAKNLIAKSTAWCLKILHSRRSSKWLCSRRNEAEISSCRRELDRLRSEMNFQLQVADYSERQESSGSSIQRWEPKIVLPQQDSEEQPAANIQAKLPKDEIQQTKEDTTGHNGNPPANHGDDRRPEPGKPDKKDESANAEGCLYCDQHCIRKIKGIPNCIQTWRKIFNDIGSNAKDQSTGVEAKPNNVTGVEAKDNNVTDSVGKIKEMLDLKPSNNDAIAVFLWGGEHTGMEALAEKVCSNLAKDTEVDSWLQVTIKGSEMEKYIDGSASNIDIVTGLRSEILEKMEHENGYKIGNEIEGEMKSDGAWEKRLSASLTKNKKVFMYIENVPSAELLKRLLPKKLIPASSIRVLLSTRDKHVTSALEDSKFKTKLYSMQPLCYKEALKFLEEKIFLKAPVVTNVLRKTVKICNGYEYPMATVGDHLSKYYEHEDDFSRLFKWIMVKAPNFKELLDYITCEAKFLSQSVLTKDALLDICSFFNNWEWDETASIVGNDALKKLEESELVRRESNKVSVPDSVMQFGFPRAQGNRVTNVADLYTSLSSEKHHEMKGIWLLHNKFRFQISSEQLDEMHASLRVLVLGDWTIVKGECKKQFKHLRYFQAGRVTNLPFSIAKLHQPRVLENTSDKDIGLSSQQVQVPSTLRMLKLKLQKVEDCIDLQKILPKACKIVELDLSSCAVDVLRKDFFEMRALQKLILSNCEKMTSLPTSLCKLKSLKILDLSHCKGLANLPSNFGWLSTLKKVNFSYCESLKDLPDSMGLLGSVEEIDLSYCKRIEKLPNSFVKLHSLRVLRLRACSHLAQLPEGFGRLYLNKLCLESCKRLQALPERIGQPILSQETVSLSWCLSLAEISNGFINLIQAHVKHLILADCTGLQTLPEDFTKQLSHLKSLNLSGCTSLIRLPKHLKKLEWLEMLDLSSCAKLEESSIRLRNLPSLKEVNLSNCKGLKGNCLENLVKNKSLTFVDIHDSPNLVARWNQMSSENIVCHFPAATGRIFLGTGSSLDSLGDSRGSSGVKGRKAESSFFNDRWFFVDLNGQPFYPSTLEKGTIVAVIFDHNYGKGELRALLNILDDLQITCTMLQIIHVGRSVSALPRELGDRHHVWSCDNYEAQVFFEKEFCRDGCFDQKISYAMITSEVVIHNAIKSFSSQTRITDDILKAMTMNVTANEYLHLKELMETPQQTNLELLRTLLLSKDINFLITSTNQVEINELEGKFVFLLLSRLDLYGKEHATLESVFENLKIKLHEKPVGNNVEFEVVWIPIVIHGRGTRAHHAEWIEKIKWPSIADPWFVNPLAMHFIRMHSSLDKLPLFIGVSPKGQLHFHNFIPKTEESGVEELYKFMKGCLGLPYDHAKEPLK